MIKYSIKELLHECNKLPNNTGSNSKCFHLRNHDDLVIVSTPVFLDDDYDLSKMLENTAILQDKLDMLQKSGVHCPKLLDFSLEKSPNFMYYVKNHLYTKVPGTSMLIPLYDSAEQHEKSESKLDDLLNAPKEHFDKFVADAMTLTNSGILIDYVNAGNFFYDKNLGFFFLDMGLSRRDFGYFENVTSPAMDVAMGVAMIFSIAFENEKKKILFSESNLVFDKYKSVFLRFVQSLQNTGITQEEWMEIRNRNFPILDQFSLDDFDSFSHIRGGEIRHDVKH